MSHEDINRPALDSKSSTEPDLLQSDAELQQSFRQGKNWALETVYRGYVGSVLELIRRGFMVAKNQSFFISGIHDEQVQADILQETFLRAFSRNARQNFDSRYSYRPYLLRIAKNLVIDRAKKFKRVVTTSGSGVGNIDAIIDRNAPFENNPTEEKVHFRQQLQVTQSYIESLQGEERRFYELRFRLAYSQEKVAHEMNLGRRRVRTLEKRLCKTLKKYLKKHKAWP